MYYQARAKALNNNQNYHLAAILRRKGKVVAIGTNSDKTHPAYKREYTDGTEGACMHAEMAVLRYSKPGDTLEVIRFLKSGGRSMAKPCDICQKLIRKYKISKTWYTNWEGERTLLG